MKQFGVRSLIFCLLLTGKVTAQQSRDYTNTFRISKSYSDDIPISLRMRLDSTVLVTAARFNQYNRSFKLVANDAAVQAIRLDFTKGKLATKKQRYAAYLVNLIVPIYIPKHKVKSSITFAEETLASSISLSVKSNAHILIGDIRKREDKMLQKYADKLLRRLNYLSSRVPPQFASSIR